MTTATTTAWSKFGERLSVEWGVRKLPPHPLADAPEQIIEPLGWSADGWQRELLHSQHQQLLVCCSRQSGKSLIAAAKALSLALTRPKSVIVLISRSLRQASEVLRKVKEINRAYRGERLRTQLWQPVPVKKLAELDTQIDSEGTVRDNELSLEFGNGSRIISMPCSPDTVVGFTVDLLILDEAARIPDSVYFPLRPMLAIARSEGRGQLLALSTPFGKRGWFWEAWKSCTESEDKCGKPDWHRLQIKASQCPRISQEFLDKERRDLGARWFQQEYETLFADAIDSVFSGEDIERALVPVGNLFQEV